MPRRSNRPEPTTLSNIEELIDSGGEITVGHLGGLCLASACDESNCPAMLRRRNDESFAQILVRLDAPIDRAWSEDFFTDEVNATD